MLTDIQHDALKEVVNQGVGTAANLLNTMLNAHIILHVPELKIIDKSRLIHFIGCPTAKLATVSLPFRGQLCGNAKLVFPAESASKLVAVFVQETLMGEDLDAIRIGTLTEIGNVVLNSLVGTLTNALDLHFEYAVPQFTENGIEHLMGKMTECDNELLYAKTTFEIETLNVQGDFILFFEMGGLSNLVLQLDRYIASLDL